MAGGDSGATDYVYVIDVATDALLGTTSLPSGASNANAVAAAPQPVPVELIRFFVEWQGGVHRVVSSRRH